RARADRLGRGVRHIADLPSSGRAHLTPGAKHNENLHLATQQVSFELVDVRRTAHLSGQLSTGRNSRSSPVQGRGPCSNRKRGQMEYPRTPAYRAENPGIGESGDHKPVRKVRLKASMSHYSRAADLRAAKKPGLPANAYLDSLHAKPRSRGSRLNELPGSCVGR